MYFLITIATIIGLGLAYLAYVGGVFLYELFSNEYKLTREMIERWKNS